MVTGLSIFPGIGHAMNPSPAKKKMSLGDYWSRRNTSSGSTPSAEKSSSLGCSADAGHRKSSEGSVDRSQDGASRPPPDESVKQEAAAQGGLQGSAIDDTVMKDDAEEPEYVPPEPMETTIESLKDASPPALASSEVSHILAQLNQMGRAGKESATASSS
jgi:hypothetical protein